MVTQPTIHTINRITRSAAIIRRLKFQFVKAIGVFWLIERIPFLTIKEPYNKLYQRAKQ